MAIVVRQPESAPAAVAAAREDGAPVVAGGTILFRLVNEGRLFPRSVVSLHRAQLDGIEIRDGEARIGATTRIGELPACPQLGFLTPAVRLFGGPALRNMATVGGNLFARQPYGDLGLCFLALDARLQVVGEAGARSVQIERFYADGIAAGDVVAAIELALPDARGWRFRKATRRTLNAAAVIAVAARLTFDGERVVDARIALSGCGRTPVRSKAAERALVGSVLDEATATRAGEAAADEVECFTDEIASAWYRRRVLPVHLRRALLGGDGAEGRVR
jgi:CO/xanthine dehydrogenase FAD-binding subunit